MRKIKIGLLGAGHLGKIHLRLLKEIADFEVIGFYDANAAIAAKVEEEFNVTAFRSAEELISACEAIDIVTPTIYHFQEAQRVLAACKHLFIEGVYCLIACVFSQLDFSKIFSKVVILFF